ncbi:sel1 repeat family protein [Pelomyxa schiedti]|nr:sel1 repeat family protein [Pelomyxa schiedti]
MSDGKLATKQRILGVSRVVWEQVVVPWVLGPALATRKWARPLPRPAVSCVLATAEAMFPLVPLATRAVLASLSSGCGVPGSRHYRTVEDAAAALCPKCIAWIISNRPTSSQQGDGGLGRGSGSGRRKAREQVAVLKGLCIGGHLVMAQRFVDYGCECWPGEEGTGNGRLQLWSFVSDTRVSGGAIADSSPVVRVSLPPSVNAALDPGTELGDEFWSERGRFHIMGEVCKYGHLEVLKWLLSGIPLQTDAKSLLEGFISEASSNGHLHILTWLLDNYDLERVATEKIATSHKIAVSDLKCLIEKYPSLHHPFLQSAAYSRRSSEDEVIEVCQWLKNRFTVNITDFFREMGVCPRYTRVLQWALSDVTNVDILRDAWLFACPSCDVELGKWFIDEKGVTPNPDEFIGACSGKHCNAAFVEWLFNKLGGSLSSDQLLECLRRAFAKQSGHSIVLFLEKCFMTLTGRMPHVSLSELVVRHNDCCDHWLEWVLTHSCSCSIDCSPTEAANAVGYIVGELTESFAATLEKSLKVELAISIWKKFNMSPVLNHDLLFKLLLGTVTHGTFFQFKEVSSLGEFSQSELDQCMGLPAYGGYFQSSKLVKLWADEYTLHMPMHMGPRYLPRVQRIFSELVFNNKRSAAQWLFNRCSISLNQVIYDFDKPPLGAKIFLATWKLVLEMSHTLLMSSTSPTLRSDALPSGTHVGVIGGEGVAIMGERDTSTPTTPCTVVGDTTIDPEVEATGMALLHMFADGNYERTLAECLHLLSTDTINSPIDQLPTEKPLSALALVLLRYVYTSRPRLFVKQRPHTVFPLEDLLEKGRKCSKRAHTCLVHLLDMACSTESLSTIGNFLYGSIYYHGVGVEKNFIECRRHLLISAEHGHPLSMNTLGLCQEKGEGIDKDLEKAVSYYRRAAELGESMAQRNLGLCYKYGEGVDKSVPDSIRFIQLSADQDNAPGMWSLGLCYKNGEGVKKDLNKAISLTRDAALHGLPTAQRDLASFYQFGEGVEKNMPEAIRLLTLSAAQGDSVAQRKLGLCYLNGDGVPKDEKKGAEFYKLSADQNNSVAQRSLGLCYQHGTGVTKNSAEAVRLYRLAAAQGYAVAQCDLGWCYRNAEGLEKDLHMAVHWYRLAAQQGNSQAQNNLALCYLKGEGVMQDMAQAASLYRQSAGSGNQWALFNLALCHRNAEGVPKDVKEAIRLFRLSASSGHESSQQNLDTFLRSQQP